MKKHTKGPWYTTGKANNIANQHTVYDEETGHSIAVTYGRGTEEESLANAHLIAAAPELLEACKTVADDTSHSTKGDLQAILRKVIAKAEGEL